MSIALAAANPDVIPAIQVNRRKLQETGWWEKIKNFTGISELSEETRHQLIIGSSVAAGGVLLISGVGYGIWKTFYSSSPLPEEANGQEDNEEVAEGGQENLINGKPKTTIIAVAGAAGREEYDRIFKALASGEEDHRVDPAAPVQEQQNDEKAWKAGLEARVTTAAGASSTGLLGTALILLAMF